MMFLLPFPKREASNRARKESPTNKLVAVLTCECRGEETAGWDGAASEGQVELLNFLNDKDYLT